MSYYDFFQFIEH